MQDIPRPRPPFLLKETSPHGRVTWYYRRGKGKRIWTHGKYGTDQFWANYENAARGEKPQPQITTKGTLAWLVDRYFDSSAFETELAAMTKRGRRAMLNQVVGTAGNLPLSRITAEQLTKGRERRKDTPHAANNYVKSMRALFKWAKDAGLIDIDPSETVAKIKVKSEPRQDWPVELVHRYWDKYQIGTRERLTIDLLLYTGLSRDILKLMRTHIRHGFFEIPRSKTGVDTCIWICPALQSSIEACPSGELILLPSPRGGPWQPDAFSVAFLRWCRDAGIPSGHTANGLRRTGATLAAENGSTDAELMAMFGWTGDDMASYYIRRANQRGLARKAGEKLSGNIEAPHLLPSRPAPKIKG